MVADLPPRDHLHDLSRSNTVQEASSENEDDSDDEEEEEQQEKKPEKKPPPMPYYEPDANSLLDAFGF